MSEKLRGAIFNALGDIEGLSVLDAFSGTGAIGFEALSRGAGSVLAIERAEYAYKQIKDHAKELLPPSLIRVHEVRNIGVRKWASESSDQFDIIIADPPYDTVRSDVLQELILHIRTDGVIILSLPSNISIDMSPLQIVKQKTYADAQLVYYKNK